MAIERACMCAMLRREADTLLMNVKEVKLGALGSSAFEIWRDIEGYLHHVLEDLSMLDALETYYDNK